MVKAPLRIRLAAVMVLMAVLSALAWWRHGCRAPAGTNLEIEIARSKLAPLLAAVPTPIRQPERLAQVAQAVGIEVMPTGPLLAPVTDSPGADVAWVETLSAWLHRTYPGRVIYLDLEPAPTASPPTDAARGPATGFLRIQMLMAEGRWWHGRLPTALDPSPPAASPPWAPIGLTALALVVAIGWMMRMLKPVPRLARRAQAALTTPHTLDLGEEGAPELRQIARAVNGLQRQRQQISEAREGLLRTISHDLKTPLTRMRLRVELIDDAAVRYGLERDLGFLDDVVAASLHRLEGRDESESVQRVDLDALLAAVAADLSSEGRPVTRGAGPERPLRCRPTAIRRALGNLVENALKYAGQAHLRVEEAARDIWIHVEDRGPGIPDDERELVIQPYYRGPAARDRDAEGIGLGLAICHRIAREHGGDLVLEDRRGGGLRASIRLPVA